MASGSGAFMRRDSWMLEGWRRAGSVGRSSRQVLSLLCPQVACLEQRSFAAAPQLRNHDAEAKRSGQTPSRCGRMAQALDRYDIAILRRAAGRRAPDQHRTGPAHRPVGRADLAPRASGSRSRATSPATAPRSTATRSAWACWPSCASTPSATPASATRELEDAIRTLPEVDRLPLHQRRRHLRAAGDGDRPRRLLALLASRRCCNLPNVKDLHTSFSLGEVKASAALPLSHLQPPRRAR